MIRLITSIMVFLTLNAFSQTTLLNESFETQPFSLTSSGSAVWSQTNALAASGSNSIKASIVLAYDTTILTTNALSSAGNGFVYLEFDHICKLEYFDFGVVEVSTDNGLTWIRLTGSQYLGSGQFANNSNKFNSVSYPLDWAPANSNAIPTNSWWRHENFDLSTISGNISQMKVRFMMIDGNGSGSAGNYGWLIDNVKITSSTSELIPPVISIIAPSPIDSAFGVGPFDVYAEITDSTGVDTAYLVYTINNVTDTVGMIQGTGINYASSIPAQPIGTIINYYITAIDNTSNSNKNNSISRNFTVYPEYKYVTIGVSASGAYQAPMFNGTVASTDTISDHISLFSAAEMLGNYGYIDQIQWFKNDANTYTGNAQLEIYFALTTANTVPATSAALQTIIANATLVYKNTNQTLPNSAGLIPFGTNLNQFIYDGTSNLYVIVRWRRSGTLTGDYIKWNYNFKASSAITFAGTTSNPTISTGSNYRPNIKIRFNSPVNNYDAGIYVIKSPAFTIVSSQNTPVTVRVRNGGNSPLTKVNVHYELDGQAFPTTQWTGTVAPAFNTNDIILGNHNFSLGAHNLKTWTSLPNDSNDQYLLNDTMRLNFYSCIAILNGTYTVGGGSADFSSIDEALEGLKQCGIVGPVVFQINPGVYETAIILNDSISGMNSTNTVTFTSITGNPKDVIIRIPSGTTIQNVVTLDKAAYFIFKDLTIDATKNGAAKGFYLFNNANHNIIDGCEIMANSSSSLQTYAIHTYLLNNNNLIQNNKVVGGYYSMYFQSSSSTRGFNNIIKNNHVSGFERNGITANYNDSIKILGNTVRKDFQQNGSTIIGISVEYCNVFEVNGNDIQVEPFAASYGLYSSYSQGISNSPGLIANNIVIVKSTTSTSTAFRALYLANSSTVDVFNNTFISSGGTSETETGYIEGAASSNLRLYNNVFANYSGNYAIEKTLTSSVSSMNYNAYYTTGGQIFKWNNNVIGKATGMTGIRAVTLMDTNSIIANPMIFSLYDGHSYSPLLNGAAKPLASVTTDFDGQPRNATTPDIGADEFDISNIDLSLVKIINPFPIDTQNRIANIGVVVINTGLDTINSYTISYALNQNIPTVYNWTGQLLPTQVDTVYPGNFTVPALANSLLVFSNTVGDTLHNYDTLNYNFIGLPIIEAELVSLNSPETGCSKTTTESVEITIKNNGLQSIANGLTANYRVNGGAIISESITSLLAANQSLVYTFSTKLNMMVGGLDSIFNIQTWVSHSADSYHINDSLFKSITSVSLLTAPIVSDTTINYGTSVTLKALTSDPVQWFSNSTSTNVLSSDSVYTTPLLFNDASYYVMANTTVPELTAYIGTANTYFGFWDFSLYGGNMSAGKYQLLYTAAELHAAGLQAGLIKSLAFNVLTGGSNVGSMSISLGTSYANLMTTSFENGTYTQVYSSAYTTIDGWNTHNFTTPYYWDGVSNLLVQVCTQGISSFAPPQLYTTTPTAMYTATAGFGVSCTSTSGQALTTRPNIRFETQGTDGCVSQRVAVNITVPSPSKDAYFTSIVEPQSGCGIASTPVVVDIVNNGFDTIPAGFTATYKINNGNYITPETVSQFIAPHDTLQYTFTTQASLPTGTDGLSYNFTFKLNVAGDAYSGNDSLITDSIFSDYTPINPIVSSFTIPYGTSATLTGIAIDTLYWFDDLNGNNLLGLGNNFHTAPLFDTTIIYAQARKTKLTTNYNIGTGTQTIADPSPYGSTLTAAKHQFIYRASELKAAGMMKGYIYSLAFDVSSVVGTILDDYSIKIGLTNQMDLNRAAFLTNLSTVYNSLGYTDVYGWNTHSFNAPFYWDGTSNIVIETCFLNQTTRPFSGVKASSTTYKSSANTTGTTNFSCVNDTMISATYSQRPNVKFNQMGYGSCGSDMMPFTVSVSNYPNIDAGIDQIIIPSNSVSSVVADTVKVLIKNYGLSNLTSAQIQWSDNGFAQTPVSWSGNLSHGQVDTVVLSNSYLFTGGVSTIKAWSVLTNDLVTSNDTAQMNLNICMSGIYTVKSTGGNFTSITNAIQSLDICGVCGPVIIDIDSGYYSGPFVSNPIQGASSSNTITFQSASLDSSYVTISNTTLQNSNYVWMINGASYIKLKYLTLIALGSTYSNVVVLKNGSNNVSVENCVLTSGNATTGEASTIVAKDVSTSNITVRNSVLNGGLRSVYFGGSTTISNNNLLFENNIIQNYNNFGTYLYYTSNVELKGNQFIASNNSQLYGIYSYYSNGIKIINNKISLIPIGSAYGMYMDLEGTASQRALIANNFISILSGTSTVYGSYITSSNYVDYVYNSMFIDNATTTSRGLYITGSTNMRILNNNLYTRSGHVFYTTSVSGIAAMDYNNLHTDVTSTTSYVYWGGNVATLAALKLQDINLNQNSLNVNPNFYTSSNLHAQENSIYNAGTPYPAITTDIDGEVRSATAPSIGADEFTPPAIDLGLVSILYPITSDCGYSSSDSVVVQLQNFGLNDINFATTPANITLQITGINPDTIVFNLNSGSILSGTSLAVKITSNYNMTANGNYSFRAFVDILNDGKASNNLAPVVEIISLPSLSIFPYVVDFESGNNITFKEIVAVNSDLTLSGSSASTGNYGLHFQGGGFSGWTNPSNVYVAYNNTTHVSKAVTCEINAVGLPLLSLKLDLKQTAYSPTTTQTNSWFRILLTNANGTFYLKNLNGDSVFRPTTPNGDPFVTHTFKLNDYVGQVFNISMEAACNYAAGVGSYSGDNVYVDNIAIWSPTNTDVGANSVALDKKYGLVGSNKIVKFVIENYGYDTLNSIPVAYKYGNNAIVRDTANFTLLPSQVDTFNFLVPITLNIGSQMLKAFTELPGDVLQANDTAQIVMNGLLAMPLDYIDDFEGSDYWFGTGTQNQWQLGAPGTSNFSSAHSGSNAWVTRLNSNYLTGASEYLYSPYFSIPLGSDTAIIKFYHKMRVVTAQAYGMLEFSNDNGATWSGIGYISDPLTTNWYNTNVNGQHAWSSVNNNWVFSSIKLDPTMFNNGQTFQLRFTFIANSNSVSDEGWIIDDFSLTVPKAAKDAGIVSILSPTSSLVVGTSSAITVRIKNFGSDSLNSIPVRFSNGSTIITETWTGSLLPDSVVDFTFNASFFASNQGFSQACATTLLPGDLKPSNNSFCMNLSVSAAAIDAALSSIIAPTGHTTINGNIGVRVMIANRGTTTLSNIPVGFKVGSFTVNETYTGQIVAGDSASYDFNATYLGPVGSYLITAYTAVAGDAFLLNDTISLNLLGTSLNDITIDGFRMGQNEPNPANELTQIPIFMPNSGDIQIVITGLEGRIILSESVSLAAGEHRYAIEANRLNPGIYYYSMTYKGQRLTKRLIVL
jgi:hypothetical protein